MFDGPRMLETCDAQVENLGDAVEAIKLLANTMEEEGRHGEASVARLAAGRVNDAVSFFVETGLKLSRGEHA